MRYLDERIESTGFDSDNAREDLPDFRELIRRGESLSEVFSALTKHLREKFNIDKGVLVLRQEQSAKLAAVSTWENGVCRDGLALGLPKETSLFEQVVRQGDVYTENFCGGFSGNFFERKLLLDEDSRSFVLQPLKSDGQVVGLLGFSSQTPTAFAMFEEGTLEPIAEEFASAIRVGKHRL